MSMTQTLQPRRAPVVEVDREAVRDQDVSKVLETIAAHGYCVAPNLITQAEADHIRAHLDALRGMEHDPKVLKLGHHRVLHLVVKHPVFHGPLRHPFVLAVWRRYLGEDMVCSTYTANTLVPRGDHVYWHADHPYWTIAEPYPTFPLAGQAVWLLDDFTAKNGATAGIPGSHKFAHLPRMGHAPDERAELLTGEKGGVILADGAWWHTPTPNTTDRPRSALLATYIRSFCTPQEDMRAQAAALEDADEELRRLLGSNVYVPQRTFPY